MHLLSEIAVFLFADFFSITFFLFVSISRYAISFLFQPFRFKRFNIFSFMSGARNIQLYALCIAQRPARARYIFAVAGFTLSRNKMADIKVYCYLMLMVFRFI